MKKFLSTTLALGLVAGLAATASALELKVTGEYVVNGYWINPGNGAAGGGGVWPFDELTTGNQQAAPVYLAGFNGAIYQDAFGRLTASTDSDSWYDHTLRMWPQLNINDKVSLKSEIRFIERDTVWGSQDDTNVADGNNFSVEKAWLLYDSPVGLFEVGRRPGGAWQGPFLNSATNDDRIMWNFPQMDNNFKGYAYLAKKTEQDGYWADLENNDSDYYEISGGYEAEGVKAWLGLGYLLDKLMDDASFGLNQSDADYWRIKGYGEYAINEQFSLATEFDWKSGSRDYASPFIADQDTDGFAILVSGIGKFDALTASLHYMFLSGDDPSTNDNEAYDAKNGSGWDFEPLYILTGQACNILNGYRGPNFVGSAVRASGAHAVVALADYAASEDLTLHGGIGWGQADEAPIGVDSDYGWEFDLGLGYKIYDNLTYELHFGWWAVGDFAELGGLTSPDDVLLLSHHLTMKF